ncbi:MAG: MFS transporter [Candidatus Pacebacteria bacterium]|nr:MFS transporter [Candidatus Paceibacterota bacterium]
MIIHGKRRRAKALAAQSRHALYALNFFFSLHLAFVAYYMSLFLINRGFPQEFIGLLYAVGSILTLASIAFAPRLLKKYGNYTNLLVLGLIELLAFLGFVFVKDLTLLFALFLIAFIIPTLIAFSLDIFLEGSSRGDSNTSGIRGIFLTIGSFAWIGAPLIGGFIVAGEHFERLFAVATLIFVPFIFLAASQLERFRDPKYIQLNIPKFAKSLARNKNLRNIFTASFLLRFFYGMMVIYFPLYIHGTLGMPLSSIGIIIAVATLAFVLLEIPLGKLEDSLWGEKEVLILGFAVIALTTASLSFLTTTSIVVWAGIMFATRVGAAMIEVSTEGYFFKQVNADDTDDVSAFRMLYPLAYIVSPLFGTIVLFFMPLKFIFLATAVVMASGVLFASALKDTK